MPVRCEPSKWELTLTAEYPVARPQREAPFRFEIAEATDGKLRGRVFDLRYEAEPSDFTGSCRTVLEGRVTAMTFSFPYRGGHFDVIGVAFAEDGQPGTFAGNFRVSGNSERPYNILDAPPESGDIGTANGSQT